MHTVIHEASRLVHRAESLCSDAFRLAERSAEIALFASKCAMDVKRLAETWTDPTLARSTSLESAWVSRKYSLMVSESHFESLTSMSSMSTEGREQRPEGSTSSTKNLWRLCIGTIGELSFQLGIEMSRLQRFLRFHDRDAELESFIRKVSSAL